jgi:hypothetical protein
VDVLRDGLWTTQIELHVKQLQQQAREFIVVDVPFCDEANDNGISRLTFAVEDSEAEDAGQSLYIRAQKLTVEPKCGKV